MKKDILNGHLSKESIKEITEFIKLNNVGIIAFKNSSDGISTYPLIILDIDMEGNIWFFINRNGQMAEQIKKTPSVTFHLHDNKNQNSMAFEGKATIVNDKKITEKLWDPKFLSWFPDGVSDRHLSLLKIGVEMIHKWESNPNKNHLKTTDEQNFNELIYT